MRRAVCGAAVLFAAVFFVATESAAQGSIAGVVKDTTGAMMPGVTVEASSPALIEKTRAAVTDGSGQYRIVDLPPGMYQVTFTLTGFRTVVRQDIQIQGTFAAQVNADLQIGALEETLAAHRERHRLDEPDGEPSHRAEVSGGVVAGPPVFATDCTLPSGRSPWPPLAQ